MSKETKQTKIEEIRNEVKEHGNTKERVAGILTDLNNDKLETSLSNLSDEGKVKLKEMIGSTATGSNFTRTNN